jgi:hypothetical protein
MARGMDGFAGADFGLALGHVDGYRWWKLAAPRLTVSPARADRDWPEQPLIGANNHAWQPGVNEAVCSTDPSHEPPVEYTKRPGLEPRDYPVSWQDSCGCVSPETRVLTADLQWVPAGDLAVGERLLAFDEYPSDPGYGKAGGRKYRDAVVASTDRGPLPCYDLEFEDGTTVRVSFDHQWLCYGGDKAAHWVRTDELRAGDLRVSRVVKPFTPWMTDTSREAGYLAAAFDGEGSFTQSHNYRCFLSFAQAGNEMLTETESCLKTLDIDYNHYIQLNSYQPLRLDGTPRLDMHRLTVAKRPDLMKLLGSVRPVRLLPKLRLDCLGRLNMRDRVRLVNKTYVGEREVVKLGTTSGTYFAEGMASHNCGFWAYWKPQEHSITGSSDAFLPILGVVRGTGRTLIGPLGFRSQQARIIALHLPFQIVKTDPLPPGRESWTNTFTVPGVHHPPHGRPSRVLGRWGREASTGSLDAFDRWLRRGEPASSPEPEDPDTHALAWTAVIEDRLATMYDAKIYTTRASLTADYPPDTRYLPQECTCGAFGGTYQRAQFRLQCPVHMFAP